MLSDIARDARSTPRAFGPSGSAGVVFERLGAECLLTSCDAMRALKRAVLLQARWGHAIIKNLPGNSTSELSGNSGQMAGL